MGKGTTAEIVASSCFRKRAANGGWGMRLWSRVAIRVLAVELLTPVVLGTAACDSSRQDLFDTMTEGEWRLDIRTAPPFPERYGVAFAEDGVFSSWYFDDMGTHETEGQWDLAKGTGGKTLLLMSKSSIYQPLPTTSAIRYDEQSDVLVLTCGQPPREWDLVIHHLPYY